MDTDVVVETEPVVAVKQRAGNGHPVQAELGITSETKPKAKPNTGVANSKPRVVKRAKVAKKTAKSPAVSVRTRAWSYPASSFEEALPLAQAMQQHAAGQSSVRRLSLFHNMDKSPDSSASRALVTNSHKYGLTEGSYKAEYITLTADGNLATSPDVSERDRMNARFRLAVEKIAPFKALYERFKGNKLPSPLFMRDSLKESGFKEVEIPGAVDTFVVNAKFLGLLQTMAGAERLLTLEHAMDGLPTTSLPTITSVPGTRSTSAPGGTVTTTDWSKTCFYITPIGQPDSDDRKHSDLFLGSIVEPAMEQLGLNVVRADQIAKPGMITSQVIEYVTKSKLVIADLSHHNPNVFYELALRHASRLPTVQLIRVSDTIPFDLDQFRTIRIDDTTLYDFVPKLEVYRAEVANQARQALTDPEAVDNPVSAFAPHLRLH